MGIVAKRKLAIKKLTETFATYSVFKKKTPLKFNLGHTIDYEKNINIVVTAEHVRIAYACDIANCKYKEHIPIQYYIYEVESGKFKYSRDDYWRRMDIVAERVNSVEELGVGSYVFDKDKMYIRCLGCYELMSVKGPFILQNGFLFPYMTGYMGMHKTMCVKCHICASEHWYCFDGISADELKALNTNRKHQATL